MTAAPPSLVPSPRFVAPALEPSTPTPDSLPRVRDEFSPSAGRPRETLTDGATGTAVVVETTTFDTVPRQMRAPLGDAADGLTIDFRGDRLETLSVASGCARPTSDASDEGYLDDECVVAGDMIYVNDSLDRTFFMAALGAAPRARNGHSGRSRTMEWPRATFRPWPMFFYLSVSARPRGSEQAGRGGKQKTKNRGGPGPKTLMLTHLR